MLDQGLTIFDRVNVILIIDVGTSNKSISIFFLFPGPPIFNTLASILLPIDLQPTNGHLQQLILSFGIKRLLMEEVFLLKFIFVFFFPSFDIPGECLQLPLVSEGILPHLVYGDLQLRDPLVFDIVVGVFNVKSVDELPQLLFLSFHVDVVGLQVFVLLFAKHVI